MSETRPRDIASCRPMSADQNRELIERLYAALDRADGDAMAACYAPDARFSDPAFGELQRERAGHPVAPHVALAVQAVDRGQPALGASPGARLPQNACRVLARIPHLVHRPARDVDLLAGSEVALLALRSEEH